MRKPKERARVKPAKAKRRDMIEWADGEEGYKIESGGAVLHHGELLPLPPRALNDPGRLVS